VLFGDVVSLLNVSAAVNELGDPAETEVSREVCADRQSIRQTEFYQAHATGFRPEVMFVVRSSEYQGETRLRYGSRSYNIIRTYERPDEMTELVCQALVVR